jgi:hypothetical protein
MVQGRALPEIGIEVSALAFVSVEQWQEFRALKKVFFDLVLVTGVLLRLEDFAADWEPKLQFHGGVVCLGGVCNRCEQHRHCNGDACEA